MSDYRILVLMSTTKDSERTRQALAGGGLACAVCQDMAELCREVERGAGAALLTEERIAADSEGCLAQALRAQPAWSDMPLVVVAREGSEGRGLRESMNATLVERPVKFRPLLSVVRAALRSRRYQYAIRDHFAERMRSAEALREKDARLQYALGAGKLGSWALDLATRRLECSELCKANYGRPADASFTYDELWEAIHPDDRMRVRGAFESAVSDGTDYDVEYRTVWPDGGVHWVLVRGRATHHSADRPKSMIGVSLDITDQKRMEEELREADRQKDDFIALLAHELRNPLAPIRNGLQVLRLASGDVDAIGQVRAMMDRQLSHMVRLIDDLLDVSRISRNKILLQRERVLLADVVESAVETARPLIDSAGHELIVSLPPRPVFLEADATRLAQVFSNLLTNSAKYTPPGGKISLVAQRQSSQLVITVRDNGIGIPAESLPRIFDMFSQVGRSVERSAGGLGLGLALVKGLVAMHGGTVTAESLGQEMGSTFTVCLPAIDKQPPPQPASASTNGRRGSGRRMLVVDDNRDSADTMAMMLRLLGEEVQTVHDGLAAVEAAEEFKPEVILMDVGMPRLNGLDATRRIRGQPWGKEITIIAVTGWGQESDKERTRAAGCDGHLVKPVRLPDLEEILAASRSRACLSLEAEESVGRSYFSPAP